jgi:hemolysin activation/secretion protein
LFYNAGLTNKFHNYDGSGVPKHHYRAVDFNYYREQFLPHDFSLFAHFKSQFVASKNGLPSNKMFYIGGRTLGRAYGAATLGGNKGTGVSVEVRQKYDIHHRLLSAMEPFVYYDTARLNKTPSDASRASLFSYGLGVRLHMPDKFMVGFEAAIPGNKRFTSQGRYGKFGTNYSFFVTKVAKF